MAQSLCKNYLHIVYWTKNGEKILADDILDELYRYSATICKSYQSPALKIGGTADHVHLLCNLSKNIALADFIEQVKKHSSKWIKTKGKCYQNFKWQNGYGAFSISNSHVDIVAKYIANQKEHHRQKTFREEYIAFLDKYEIEYNSRYLWT